MKKIWVNIAKSFEEAQDFDTAYYLNLSSTERVESVQILREEFFKSHGLRFREDGKRLRRVFRVIEQAHNVRYCVIGAFALAFHAQPRYTKDIDILIEPTTDNAKRLLIALEEFGFGSLNLAVNDFTTQGNIIQLGYEPIRINIITSIKGLEFAEIWKSRIKGPYGKQTINFIDRQNLIRTKKLSNRVQDKADLELLLSESAKI
jgi:hypothetical protein